MDSRHVKHKHTYKKLQKFLESNGYTVTKTTNREWKTKFFHFKTYNFYTVKGNGIVGGFCTKNRSSYPYINGRICVDNIECFDKWSKCPLIMVIENIDYNKLLECLKFLGSKEGFELSNNFESHELFIKELK